MTDQSIEELFQPLPLGSLKLRNRFVMPGMQRGWCDNGAPTPKMADYYSRRVKGGVSLIISESCAVAHPSATAQPKAARMNTATASEWSRCIEAVRKVDGRFFIQLWHEGAMRDNSDGLTISPSGLGYPGFERGSAATKDALSEVIDAYAESASLVKEAGADGIELHCAHGYFLDQFLWPKTNLRDDAFGGDTLASRAHLHSLIVKAIRSACGNDFVISVRFSQWKEKDFAARIAETPEELGEFLRLLISAGVNVFHASTRRFWEPAWEGGHDTLAGWTRKLSGTPSIAVGSVGLDRDVMQSFSQEGEASGNVRETISLLGWAFAAGQFDLISVGRSLIGDPDWVNKLQAGEIGKIRSFRKSDLADFEWEE